jgi:hypothetical protein
VAGLKASTAFNNGKFPAGLTVADLGQAMQGTLADPSQLEQRMQENATNIMAVTRAWTYMTDAKNGSDWNYAGAQVPLNTKNRAILWYKPAGKQGYTVFYADLTVQSAAEAPTEKAVPMIPGTGGKLP